MSDLPSSNPAASGGTGALVVLRSLVFNLAFYSWTTLACLIGLPVLLLPRVWVVAYARSWERGIQLLLRWLVGLEHELRGQALLPSGPAIYAFKHQSAWETMVIHLLLPDPAIALKRELTWIPLFGWFLIRTGMIRIDRGAGSQALRSLLKGAEAAAARGSPIVIFPEGTRVAPGATGPYHPGVAALYGKLGLPVVPVALNSGLFWRRRGFLKRPGRITVEFLEPIAPGLDRRRFMAVLAERLETASRRLAARPAAAS